MVVFVDEGRRTKDREETMLGEVRMMQPLTKSRQSLDTREAGSGLPSRSSRMN